MAQTHLDFNNSLRPSLTILDRLQRIPWPLFLVATILGGFGVTMLFTVSQGSWTPWALKHMQRLAILLPLGIIIALIDIRFWYRMAYPIYGVAIILLLLVAVIGTENNNAQRWIDLGFMELQPSEIAQISVVMVLARYFHGLTFDETGKLWRLIIAGILVAIPFFLIVTQPDLGTSLKLAMISFALFFAAGMRWWKVIIVIAAAAAFPIGILVWGVEQFVTWGILKEFQAQRIMTLFVCEDIRDDCYQIFNSLTAIGNGGWFGRGFGEGSQIQNDFLPEAQTDFILAAIGEELGFAGVLSFFGVQAMLLTMALIVAIRSHSQFGRLLAIGLMVNLFLYLFINAGMIAAWLPVVGVPLPLVSHGGTAMLVAVGIVGLLGSVSIHHDVPIDRLAGERDILA